MTVTKNERFPKNLKKNNGGGAIRSKFNFFSFSKFYSKPLIVYSEALIVLELWVKYIKVQIKCRNLCFLRLTGYGGFASSIIGYVLYESLWLGDPWLIRISKWWIMILKIFQDF